MLCWSERFSLRSSVDLSRTSNWAIRFTISSRRVLLKFADRSTIMFSARFGELSDLNPSPFQTWCGGSFAAWEWVPLHRSVWDCVLESAWMGPVINRLMVWSKSGRAPVSDRGLAKIRHWSLLRRVAIAKAVFFISDNFYTCVIECDYRITCSKVNANCFFHI